MVGCNSQSSTRYYTGLVVPVGAFIGICFNKNCTSADINDNQVLFFTKLNEILAPLNVTLPPEIFQYSVSTTDPNLVYP